MIVGVMEIGRRDENLPGTGRMRLYGISDYTAPTLHSFVENGVAKGSAAKIDGLPSCNNLQRADPDKQVIGHQLTHNTLARIHCIFSNVKAWEICTCHGPGQSTYNPASTDSYSVSIQGCIGTQA